MDIIYLEFEFLHAQNEDYFSRTLQKLTRDCRFWTSRIFVIDGDVKDSLASCEGLAIIGTLVHKDKMSNKTSYTQ